MADDLPDPPVPPDADLKDFPFTPLYRARLFGSSFHARATDAEWRAGVTLWLKSQDQVPAGSLPDDDIDLCRLAELGRDLKTWRKLKAGALHGWYRCSDGKLYHKVVAEVVAEQHLSKLRRKWTTECARARKHAQRHSVAVDIPDFGEWLSQGQPELVPKTPPPSHSDPPPMSQGQPEHVPETNPQCHAENGSKGQGEGQGQGQGHLYGSPDGDPDDSAPSEILPARGSRGTGSRGCRLPADWEPSPEDRGFAASCGLDPDEVAEEFRDYWRAIPGSKGTKLDWSATYRNRCRELAGRRRGNGAVRPRAGGSDVGGIVAALGSFRLPGEMD